MAAPKEHLDDAKLANEGKEEEETSEPIIFSDGSRLVSAQQWLDDSDDDLSKLAINQMHRGASRGRFRGRGRSFRGRGRARGRGRPYRGRGRGRGRGRNDCPIGSAPPVATAMPPYSDSAFAIANLQSIMSLFLFLVH